MRGRSDLSIVSTESFSARHIHNFWNYRGKDALAIAVAVDNLASGIVGIGMFQNEVQTIHVYDGGDGVSIFEANDIIPEVNAWLCIEVSKSGDVFFIGGAQEKNYTYGDAFIAAISFEEEAELINFARYGDDLKLHCVSSLRRHPEGDILFAGCYGKVAILLWASEQFHLIRIFPNCVNNPVSDLCFQNNALYAVSDSNKGLACYFDDYFPQQKATSSPDSPHGRYRNLPKQHRPLGEALTLAQKYQHREPIPAKYRSLFRDYTIQQIELPGCELQRVQVSPDEKYIYAGKNELKVLENRGGRFKFLDMATHVQPFIDLKLLPSGDVIIFDKATSDLIKYDHNLNQIQRLPGKKPIVIDGNDIVTTLYSGDSKVYIWMLGDGSIALCNPDSMVYDLCANFFGNFQEQTTPFSAVASIIQSKVIGMYLQNQMIHFVFLRGVEGIIRKLQSEILGESKTLLLSFNFSPTIDLLRFISNNFRGNNHVYGKFCR